MCIIYYHLNSLRKQWLMYVRIQNHGSEGNDSISQQTGHILLHISSIKIFFRFGFYLLKMEHQEGYSFFFVQNSKKTVFEPEISSKLQINVLYFEKVRTFFEFLNIFIDKNFFCICKQKLWNGRKCFCKTWNIFWSCEQIMKFRTNF